MRSAIDVWRVPMSNATWWDAAVSGGDASECAGGGSMSREKRDHEAEILRRLNRRSDALADGGRGRSGENLRKSR